MGELRAAGFVVFRRVASQIQYLLLQASYEPHHWTPPKGHVDPGEGDMETALRETEEEAGFAKQDLAVTEYTQTMNYLVRGRPKTVVYWLAELRDPETPVKLSDEHKAFAWLPLADAVPRAHFPQIGDLLSGCQAFIDSLNHS